MEVIDKNEYISKIEVVRILQKAYAEGRIQAKDGCTSVLDDIAAIKADVQPIRHGRWVTVRVDGDSETICNNCYENTIMRTDFCPHCGADMRGDENG